MEEEPVRCPQLTEKISADLVVIGSGVAGLTVAHELAKQGASVAVLDRGEIARGISARTTAHLVFSNDATYSEIVRLHGEEHARLCFQSEKAAIDRIEEIVRENRIACDFARVDAVLFAPKEDDVSTLEDEIEACKKVGFDDVDWTRDVPLNGPVAKAIRYPNQARFHPTKYLDGLARVLQKKGVRLFGRSDVWTIKETADGVSVETEAAGIVEAKYAVAATNSPITKNVAIHAKQAPYRTYAFAAQVKRGAIPDRLYWDTLSPYHYVRLQPGTKQYDYLIVGGEDHKSGSENDGDERCKRLERWAHDYFPALGKITHRWSGQVFESVDKLGYIGLNPGDKRTYIVTGDSGIGWTHGTLGGMIIANLIRNGRASWADLYSPERMTPKAVTDFVSENTTAVKNFAEYIMPGDITSLDKLPRGEGAIVTEGTKKLAVYRDKQGKLHKRSASCTHLGCLVHWNSFESCWDCPCHGSHFGPKGEVLQAPAISPLGPAPKS